MHDSARKRKLAPFLQAGFACRAVVFITPDHLLFGRQHRQFVSENKVVPDEAIAEMKGKEGCRGVGSRGFRVMYGLTRQ